MALHFTCTGTARGQQGIYDTKAMIFRNMEDGQKNYVGTIKDHFCMMDIRDTEIRYGGKTLSFREVYDTPLIWHVDSGFWENDRYAPVSLHSFADSGQKYLEYRGNLYQITQDEPVKGQHWRITVFSSRYQVAVDGLHYPPMTQIHVKKNGDQIMWDVKIKEDIPQELVMAILSLPFTAPLHTLL